MNNQHSIETGVKRLIQEFNKNEIRFRLKKRTETVAMYEQLANYSDTVLAIEVFRIKVLPPNKFIKTHYEKFPSNEEIGKSLGAKSFGGKNKLKQAEEYFVVLEKECRTSVVQTDSIRLPLPKKVA